MKKMLSLLLALMLIVAAPCAMADEATGDSPIEIKALILPKFESGEMTGDFPGEAQSFTHLIHCRSGQAVYYAVRKLH